MTLRCVIGVWTPLFQCTHTGLLISENIIAVVKRGDGERAAEREKKESVGERRGRVKE